MNVYQFVKTWHVWYLAGPGDLLQPGAKIEIGMDEGTAPFLNPEGETCVGYVVINPDGTGFGSKEHGPLKLVDAKLRWTGDGTHGVLKRIYISLAEAVDEVNGYSSSLYGTMLAGDPEQVAVWGANDGPPPKPI